MCEECRTTVAQIWPIIHAIEEHRNELTGLLHKIHHGMDEQLIVTLDPEGNQIPQDLRESPHGRSMLLSYLAAFLAGQLPDDIEFRTAFVEFFNAGMAHGTAYATVRQTQLN